MAQMLLIMGESGTGKSTSMRNCDPATTAVVNPVGKPLPFKGKFTMLNSEVESRKICKFMKEQAAAGKKLLVVDDFQYILSVPYMNRIKENGWDKWNDFGANYFEIIEVCKELPDDVVVAYMTHTETLENGVTTIKLIGKLLREKITIEGLFTIVLRTGVNEGKYYFYTQNSGKDTVKSPMGMFPAYAIDNDLNYVADKIRNFYEVGEYKTDAEMGQADAAVAADVTKPDANGRRARGGKKTTTETATPPQVAEQAAEPEQSASTGRSGRTRKTSTKTHDEVVAENQEKINNYMEQCDEAIAKASGDREEIPFEEAVAATENIPQPELETPPRRTRKERKSAEQSEPVQDGTTNTDSESVTLDADTYFYVPADDNYVMKHKGDTVDLIVDGVEVMKVISKEEFGEGVKRLAQADNPKPENPIDGAMNPPEKGRRTRRSAAQAQPDNADTTADETPAVDEQPTGRTRRVRKTR
jgi:hypothetical protein